MIPLPEIEESWRVSSVYMEFVFKVALAMMTKGPRTKCLKTGLASHDCLDLRSR